MKRRLFAGVGAALLCMITGCATTDSGEEVKAMPPFGGEDSVAYAQALWHSLTERHFVGPGAITAKPYQGTHPHGVVLVTYEGEVKVDKHIGFVIVKNNYAGATVSELSVANDPTQDLDAVTVMFKREADYDPDNEDWFWVKYQADGSLHVDSQGAPLAGRVAKGQRQGCIACHKLAPGGDFVYNHNRFTN